VQRPPGVDNDPVQPFWMVYAVYDPEGGGRDLAYTVGLAPRGLPELQVWARPTDGLDPGEDWKFSQQDCIRLLNEFGDLLVRGRLEVGDVVERTFDGGAARAVFTVGAAVEPDAVEAYQVSPGAAVLPLRWRLEREPVGLPAEVADEERCRADLAALLASIPPSAKPPPGWRRPTANASFRLDQPYGPLTPLVRAQGIAIATASPVQLVDFISRQLDAESSVGPRNILAMTAAAARTVGRVRPVAEARKAAHGIVNHVRGPVARTPRWREVLAITGFTADETSQLHTGMSGVLLDGTQAVLTLQAVADVADQHTRLAGFGPWRAAMSPSGMVAGSDWLASAPVLATVRRLLIGLEPWEVQLLAQTYLAARDDWGGLPMRLRGWAVTSPAGAPPASELLRGTPAGAVLEASPDADDVMTELLCCMTAALSNRAHLTAAEVDRLSAPMTTLIPHLRNVLHEPITVEAPH
jgi:hypothetical protein